MIDFFIVLIYNIYIRYNPGWILKKKGISSKWTTIT